jgi:phosphoglycolate phosphatase-like HAD superfamily hydrolase
MNHIKLIAVNLDGVLLKDTFSPVIRKIVMHFGSRYTHMVERNILSRPQNEAAQYLIKIAKINYNIQDLLELFFQERENYIKENGNGMFEATPLFLRLLRKQNTKLVCYGGLPSTYFESEMKRYGSIFDFYICTNDFRPGIKEITDEIYNLKYSEVLFIDDVNSVALTAKRMNVPFIGCPTNSQWGFQKQEMQRTGVKYIVESVGEVSQEILDNVDADASKGLVWS